jgi:hypothetical protein
VVGLEDELAVFAIAVAGWQVSEIIFHVLENAAAITGNDDSAHEVWILL